MGAADPGRYDSLRLTRLLPGEGAYAWEEALEELRRRGLRRGHLFITDGLPGMEDASRRVHPLAQWQWCVVRQVRGSLGKVRVQDRGAVAQELKSFYMAESRQAVHLR